MMKKKIFLGLAMATLVFTGCSKSDITESLDNGSKLNFRLSSGKTTKAVTETNIAALEAAGSVSLFAYDKDGNSFKFPGYSANEIILNYTSTDTPPWNPAQDVYLPDRDIYPIALYSTYPKQALNQTGNATEYSFDYTVSTTGTADLLVAKAKIENKDAITTAINYEHALSQVIVTVKYTKQISGTTATVTNCVVSAENVGTGTYTFTPSAVGSWTSLPGGGDYSYGDKTVPNGTTDALELDRFIYFPQTITILSFHWSINDADGGVVKEGDVNTEGTGSISVVMAAGKRYYLDIVIDGTMPKHTFTVTETEWKDGNHTDVDVP